MAPGVLAPSTEAFSKPNVYARLNLNVTEISCGEFVKLQEKPSCFSSHDLRRENQEVIPLSIHSGIQEEETRWDSAQTGHNGSLFFLNRVRLILLCLQRHTQPDNDPHWVTGPSVDAQLRWECRRRRRRVAIKMNTARSRTDHSIISQTDSQSQPVRQTNTTSWRLMIDTWTWHNHHLSNISADVSLVETPWH